MFELKEGESSLSHFMDSKIKVGFIFSFSPWGTSMQTSGGGSVLLGDIFSAFKSVMYLGGYHQCIKGCSILWKGYHQYIGRCSVQWRDAISTLEDV